MSGLTSLTWWLCMGLALLTAMYLLYVCLATSLPVLGHSGVAQAQSTGASLIQPSQATPGSSPNTSQLSNSTVSSNPPEAVLQKLIELETRINETSKRIDEIGNHTTRVLNVIGLLVGFFSVVVAIGLWHAKQYVERVVAAAELSMGKSLEEETKKQLKAIEHAMRDQFKEIEKLEERSHIALQEIKEIQAEVVTDLTALFTNRMNAYLRVGIPLIERLQLIFTKAIDTAQIKGLITANEGADSRKELDAIIWKQAEVARALLYLESGNEDEVVSGCQVLAALGDRACLLSLEQAKARFARKQQVTEHISIAIKQILLAQN